MNMKSKASTCVAMLLVGLVESESAESGVELSERIDAAVDDAIDALAPQDHAAHELGLLRHSLNELKRAAPSAAPAETDAMLLALLTSRRYNDQTLRALLAQHIEALGGSAAPFTDDCDEAPR